MPGCGGREVGGGGTLFARHLATAIALEADQFPATTIDSRRSAAVAPTPAMRKDSKASETAPILEMRKCSLPWDHVRTLAMQKGSKASEIATILETRKCSLPWDHVRTLAMQKGSRASETATIPETRKCSLPWDHVRTLAMRKGSKASETATIPETRTCSRRWHHVLTLATWTGSRLAPVPAAVTGSVVRTLETTSGSPRLVHVPLPVRGREMVATAKQAISDHLVLPTLDWRHAIVHPKEMVGMVRLTDTVRTLGFKGNGGR